MIENETRHKARRTSPLRCIPSLRNRASALSVGRASRSFSIESFRIPRKSSSGTCYVKMHWKTVFLSTIRFHASVPEHNFLGERFARCLRASWSSGKNFQYNATNAYICNNIWCRDSEMRACEVNTRENFKYQRTGFKLQYMYKTRTELSKHVDEIRQIESRMSERRSVWAIAYHCCNFAEPSCDPNLYPDQGQKERGKLTASLEKETINFSVNYRWFWIRRETEVSASYCLAAAYNVFARLKIQQNKSKLTLSLLNKLCCLVDDNTS